MTIPQFNLTKGEHITAEDGLCAMEAVAWLAGVWHTDKPKCTCPVIAKFVIAGQDLMPDDTRQRLNEYLPKLIGTVNTHYEQTRLEIAIQAAGVEFAYRALCGHGWHEEAKEFKTAFLAKNFERVQVITKSFSHIEAVWYAYEAVSFRSTNYASLAASGASKITNVVLKNEVWNAWFATLDTMIEAGPHGSELTPDMKQRMLDYQEIVK